MSLKPIKHPSDRGNTYFRSGIPAQLVGGYEILQKYGYKIYMDPIKRRLALKKACEALQETRVRQILWKMYHRNQRPRVKDIIFSDIVWLENYFR